MSVSQAIMHKDILGGVAVFAGTRVPVRAMMDYLAAGDSLHQFLSDFPTVTKEQAQALLSSMLANISYAHNSG